MTTNEDIYAYPVLGMAPGETLLQKWSAMAMQGILATFSASLNISPALAEQVAKESVSCAKALITELNKEV